MTRDYYSIRLGIARKPEISLEKLRQLFTIIYENLIENGYFQEYFGYYCVDEGFVQGRFGSENLIEMKVFNSLGNELWPFLNSIPECDENEVFDIIEFLFDHISAPLSGKGWWHKYCECGWHFRNLDTDFNKGEGQKEFRKRIDEILEKYDKGYKLTEEGEIIKIADKGFEALLNKTVPFADSDLNLQLDHAIHLFRDRHSNLDDRRDALRNLSDILESLRKEASDVLTDNDESDIFHLLNQFGIRHYNPQQKTNYDRDIFYSWMFYYFLASIHACQRLINRKKS